MIQDPKEIEASYLTADPWGFQSNPDDQNRKAEILRACAVYAPESGLYDRAIDLGAGEGWITKDLPSHEIHGYEISQNAKRRFPPNVLDCRVPTGKFDLILMTGVMYFHYDYERLLKIADLHSAKGTIIVTCNIAEWEVKLREIATDNVNAGCWLGFKQKQVDFFKYREYEQCLRVFEV